MKTMMTRRRKRRKRIVWEEKTYGKEDGDL